jgi:hypothetical protein
MDMRKLVGRNAPLLPIILSLSKDEPSGLSHAADRPILFA